MCLFALSRQLFKIVLGFTPRRRPWKACPSQNDDFLPRFGIHPLQRGLQGRSIPKRFGTTRFRPAASRQKAAAKGCRRARRQQARRRQVSLPLTTLAAATRQFGLAHSTLAAATETTATRLTGHRRQSRRHRKSHSRSHYHKAYRAPPPKPPPEKPPPPPKEVWPPIPALAALACWAAEALVME